MRTFLIMPFCNVLQFFQRNLCCEHEFCIEEAWRCARGGRILKVTYELADLEGLRDREVGEADTVAEPEHHEEVELGVEALALEFDAASSASGPTQSRFAESVRSTWKAFRG